MDQQENNNNSNNEEVKTTNNDSKNENSEEKKTFKFGVQNPEALERIKVDKAIKERETERTFSQKSDSESEEEEGESGVELVDLSNPDQIKNIAGKKIKEIQKLKKELSKKDKLIAAYEAERKITADYALLSNYGYKLDSKSYSLVKKLCDGNITKEKLKEYSEMNEFKFLMSSDVSAEETEKETKENQNPFWKTWSAQMKKEQEIRNKNKK